MRGVQDTLSQTAAPKLRFFRSSVALDASPALPSRLQLLHWGCNPSTEGPVILDAATLAVFSNHQSALGRQRVALDFEHNTVPGTEEYQRTTEPRSVAAFGTPVVVAGAGLFLENLAWTPEGRRSALNFEDLSAAPFLDAAGRVVALHSAALTRAGAVYDLPTLLDQAELAAMSATLRRHSPNPPETHQNPMDPNQSLTIAELAPALGLPAAASRAEVLAAFASLGALSSLVTLDQSRPVTLGAAPLHNGRLALVDDVATLADRLDRLETAGRKPSATLSATPEGRTVPFSAEDVLRLRTQVESLSAAIQQREDHSAAAERSRLLDEAAQAGKLIPLSADTARTLPLPALKELLAALPKNVVPLHARRGAAAGKSELKGLARVAAAINAQLAGN